MTVTFELERETKNTFRFSENAENPVIGTLYVQKSAFADETPRTLTVTIEASQ
jgi:hypothetical protein